MAGLLICVSTVDILFIFCCETCDVSTLVGMTMLNLCIIQMITMITFAWTALYY